MNRESLFGFLFQYTLETVCKGNRNELARRLEIDPIEIRRLLRRYKVGGNSSVAAEALLKMYAQDPDLSMDDALSKISEMIAEESDHVPLVVPSFYEMLQDIGVAYREEYLWRQEKSDELSTEAKVFKYADEFMGKLKRLFCDRNGTDSNRCRECTFGGELAECPCIQFSKYTEWLRALLVESRNKAEGI